MEEDLTLFVYLLLGAVLENFMSVRKDSNRHFLRMASQISGGCGTIHINSENENSNGLRNKPSFLEELIAGRLTSTAVLQFLI